ncbi:nitroreductase family protein [Echinicola arenosa]|nr:nitroreductase family protein [Echinicola arenosa]
MSGLYYILFSGNFKREQYAVLNGKVSHLKKLKNDKSNIYTLIRNTHRIEKGLLMRPRRRVFALDYIEETTDAFINVWDRNLVSSEKQHKWFYDVLFEYFKVTEEHAVISNCRSKFEAKTNGCFKNGMVDNLSIPYNRDAKSRSTITYDEFYKLTKYRRSVRWFLSKPVPRELVDKAILAAVQSPSACNRQPFEYRIIDDANLLRKVRSIPRGVKGYENGIPMIVVVIGNLDAYFHERDRHIIYIDSSLANMTFMLALETLGLSSCSINWPDIEELELEMEEVLSLEKYQRPIMCMAIGYPDPEGKVAFSEKKSLSTIRKYN